MPALLSPNDIRDNLCAWYRREPGRLLLEAERAQLDDALQDLFGYHLLQIGCPHPEYLLGASRIPHTVILDAVVPEIEGASRLCGLADMLPIASDSIDVVVLPHTLEFEADPHQVLREVERILIPEGHVIILGFNPWSLFGVWRVARRRRKAPWRGQFISIMRINDWLALLGFDAVSLQLYFFRPPLKSERILRRLRFLDTLGERLWPRLGGGYTLVAKKRVATLTPLKPRWRTPQLIGNLATPPPQPTVNRDRD